MTTSARSVLNAIVWAAGGEVPEDGVASATPTTEEMEANQDEPKPAVKPVEQRRSQDRRPTPRRQARPSPRSSPRSSRPRRPTMQSKSTSTSPGRRAVSGRDRWREWVRLRLGRLGRAAVGSMRQEERVRVVDGQEQKYTCNNGVDIALTELKWKAAVDQWGKSAKARTARAASLRIAGKAVEYGIGTHANSVIEFDLPDGPPVHPVQGPRRPRQRRHRSGGGAASSVQFHGLHPKARQRRSRLPRKAVGGSVTGEPRVGRCRRATRRPSGPRSDRSSPPSRC